MGFPRVTYPGILDDLNDWPSLSLVDPGDLSRQDRR